MGKFSTAYFVINLRSQLTRGPMYDSAEVYESGKITRREISRLVSRVINTLFHH
jgi:hypothetical protein